MLTWDWDEYWDSERSMIAIKPGCYPWDFDKSTGSMITIITRVLHMGPGIGTRLMGIGGVCSP